MPMDRAQFAQRLKSNKTVWVAGVYDALSAKLVEAAGFEAAMTSGFGVSASFLGQPDAELYTMVGEPRCRAQCGERGEDTRHRRYRHGLW